MEKFESWFQQLNQKMDRVGQDLLAIRGDLSDLREFIEGHQIDIRLCKLAIERVDQKVDGLYSTVNKLIISIN